VPLWFKKNNLIYSIKENTWIARIAARKLKASSVAIVIGSTIHLWNTSREDFLADERWLKHELCHVAQFRRYGFLNFIARYLWESWRNGYYNNKFEIEARKAEELRETKDELRIH
jgi:hypothetical protein